MLVVREFGLEYGNGDFGLGRDVLEFGNDLANGHRAFVLLCGIIRPAEQDRDEIRYRSVLEENAVEGREARATR